MGANEQRINKVAVPIATLDPVTGAQAGVNSIWVDMSLEHSVLALLQAGVVGTTVDFKLEQATDNAGAGAKDITGKAITQLTGDLDGVVTIECQNYELDNANGFKFLSMQVTAVGATTAASAVLIGGVYGRYQPSTTISAEDVELVIT